MTHPNAESVGTEIVQADQVREIRTFDNDFDVSSLLGSVGTLNASPSQAAVLFDNIDPDDILIRPDGQVYLDWQWYAGRLTKAFPLRWALVPQGMPKIKDNFVVWGFWLVIDGHLMGFALGEQTRANSNMTYSECCEGAKSNALMRLCKGLGMARNLWHKPFLDDWKSKYAEQTRDSRDKLVWRRKTPANIETSEDYGIAAAKPVEPTKLVRTITIWSGSEKPADEKLGPKVAGTVQFEQTFVQKFNHGEHFRNHIEKHFGVDRGGELTWDQANALYDHLYNDKHDPRWYKPEPKPEVIISGWDAHEQAKKLYIDKGLGDLYTGLYKHMETVLGNINGQTYLKSLKDILVAITETGVYQNPPTDEDIVDIKAALDNEFRKNVSPT